MSFYKPWHMAVFVDRCNTLGFVVSGATCSKIPFGIYRDKLRHDIDIRLVLECTTPEQVTELAEAEVAIAKVMQ